MRSLMLAVLTAGIAAAQGAKVLKSDSEAAAVAFSKDGKSVGVFSRDGKLRIWNIASGSVTRTIERKEGDSAPMFLAADGQFALLNREGAAAIRDLESGSVIRSLAISAPRVAQLVSTEDGATYAGGGRDGVSGSGNLVRVWDSAGKQRFAVPAGIGGLAAMTFSPDGETLAASAYDTDVRIWSARNGELKRVITDMTVSMFELAFSPDGKLLAAAGVDRTIYLFDAKSWKLLRKITGQPEMISAMEFSPDGRLLLTGGMNELAFTAPVKVMVWDVAAGKPIRSVDAEHRVNSVAFSPDGSRFTFADGSKNIPIWGVR